MAELKSMSKSKSYVTSEELKGHNKPGDLWISIQGKVYDVSYWIKSHPGGEFPLLNLAGQDVTDVFLAFHPGSPPNHLEKFFNGLYLEDYAVSEVSKDYRKLVYEFTKSGLYEQKRHFVFMSLCFMTMLFSLSISGVLYSENVFIHLLAGGLMGLFWIQNGWLVHDSGHNNLVMPTKEITRWMLFLSGNCLGGISVAWWKWIHNSHHIACNSLEFDPDLQHMPFFAVSPKFFSSLTSYCYNRKMTFDTASRFLVSYQHWSYYPVMLLARINLWAQSILLVFSAERKVPHRIQEILGVLTFWIWYPLLVSYLPNWGERAMFVLVSLLVTGIQQVQFTLNHFSTNVYIGKPNGNDWFEKQTGGTLDISCSPWMDWFHGGLQFQTEHHLFPKIPRCHLRTVSPFVSELCKKHKLPYNVASFWEANVLTIKTLRNAAIQARDLTIPNPKNLVWEAVNTHG